MGQFYRSAPAPGKHDCACSALYKPFNGAKAQGGHTIPTQASPVQPDLGTAPRQLQNGKGLLLMALGMFLFSAVDTSAKFLTESLHPLQIVWTRQLGLVFGAIVLIAWKGSSILKTHHPRLQILRGAAAAFSAALFIFAVSYVPLADAVAISFVAPFLVTLMGALILREPVGLRRWAAVGLGFVGTMIVLRPGTGAVHPAAALVIVAALLFAIRQIISRALSDTDKTGTTVVYTALVSGLILTIPLPFVWQTPGSEQIALLAAIAVVAACAEVCVIKALELAMAVVVAPVQYSLMIWGTFYGWLIFDQLPDGWTWTGAVIIIATGLYTLHREHRVARRK